MKLRIKGNSIRLRLSRSDVEKFGMDGFISESIDFPGQQLIYVLQRSVDDDLKADLNDNIITVHMPEAMAKELVNSEIVGYNSNLRTGDTGSLFILVEKDFQCLDETVEDQSDNYENPNKAC